MPSPSSHRAPPDGLDAGDNGHMRSPKVSPPLASWKPAGSMRSPRRHATSIPSVLMESRDAGEPASPVRRAAARRRPAERPAPAPRRELGASRLRAGTIAQRRREQLQGCAARRRSLSEWTNRSSPDSRCPDAWNLIATAAPLPFHRCRSEWEAIARRQTPGLRPRRVSRMRVLGACLHAPSRRDRRSIDTAAGRARRYFRCQGPPDP
jgi:hypothetical protein